MTTDKTIEEYEDYCANCHQGLRENQPRYRIFGQTWCTLCRPCWVEWKSLKQLENKS